MSNSIPIRVALADNHPATRLGVRTALEQAGDIHIVGEAGDGHAAVRLVADASPDVLVLDMELPGICGVEVARQLQGTSVQILALSACDHERYVFELLAIGAGGYLMKDEALSTIVEAVRGVGQGQTGWLSRRVAAKVMKERAVGAQATEQPAAALSARELQVLRLVARGYGNEQIATSLRIAEGTVKNHVTNIYSKLGVCTRTEAAAYAWSQGWVSRVNGEL